MYLRRCSRRKNGKSHAYWALVESYRTAQGSRQRVVAYLGNLKSSEKGGWAYLGKRLQGQHKPLPSLIDPPDYQEPDEEVLVQLKSIRLERLRDFGDVWLAWGLWRLLELDQLLAGLLPPGREDVPWPTVAAILTLTRFASRRASCTSSTLGIAAPPWKICSACPCRRCIPSGCMPASIACCL